MKLFVIAVAFILATSVIAHAETEGVQSSSTASDQKSVALTVYNVNIGLVKEERVLKLPTGRVLLSYMDVAADIIPQSVSIHALAGEKVLSVLEQNYEYDLLTPQKLLDKYVGKEVKLYQKNYYNDKEEVVKATVLSNNNGAAVFKIGDEITYNHPGRIIFPKLPENLIAKPTLQWLLNNEGTSEQKVDVTYLTNGINWRADYVLLLNQKDTRADLTGWVTIENKSGANYAGAKLKLVAGDVNRVIENAYRDAAAYKSMPVAAAPAQQSFKEEGFFEYHIYTLNRPSTIKNNQIKQIRLLKEDNLVVHKDFVFRGQPYYFRSVYRDNIPKEKVGVYVEIDNRKDNNLGIPIPKGTVRVYKADSEGALQFIGEDTVDHTPKDEKIRIKMGDAFDITGQHKQTDWKKLEWDTYEASFEIVLKNHKKEDVRVRVLEPVPGEWKVLNNSHAYKKAESNLLEFAIDVPKDGEVKLNYTVSMKF
ncbi:MAG: DUF4139 domain-containing protein [Nitrospirae bacterium]|nr:DUF4139 domain-containing protein [Nitrospirota bacterium]MBF0534792.1 DUF4139 domain-containing protein [Nitrospirota bacterium]MBF0616466.1 DUF4139 domain-containing protein [Nitrospirota bacterium]